MAEVAAMENIPESSVPANPVKDKFKYHVCFSGAQSDEPLIEHISGQLRKQGYIIPDLLPGENIFKPIDDHIQNSAVVVVVYSGEYANNCCEEYERVCALSKNYLECRKAAITIYHQIEEDQVPIYARDYKYICTKSDHFWPKLLEAINNTDNPFENTLEVKGVGKGFAYSYFKKYLMFAVPEMVENITKICIAAPKVFVILMPSSGDCFRKDIHTNNDYVKQSSETCVTLKNVGPGKRSYESYVWEVTNPDDDQEKYTLIMEFATPLCTLYEMELSMLSRLGHGRKYEIEQFKVWLDCLLKKEPNKTVEYVLLSFEDRAPTGSTYDKSTLAKTP